MNKSPCLQIFTTVILMSLLTLFVGCTDSKNETPVKSGDYVLVINGYDWGPAVSQVILPLESPQSNVDKSNFQVAVTRSTDLMEMTSEEASGNRIVNNAYLSDDKGVQSSEGNYITLDLAVGPDMALGSPIKYIFGSGLGSNRWINYKLQITDSISGRVWNSESGRITPLLDEFDLTGRYQYQDSLSMSYASFTPNHGTDETLPLIIWLHGGGEGGADSSIPLIANRAANYASPEIQDIFGGAYVLVPQCPGAWMHNAEGVMTMGAEDDIYNRIL